MKALILLTLLGIIWLVSSRRWRHRYLMPITILVVIYLGVASPLGVSLLAQGLTASLPRDSGETVDSIVVLGRGDNVRNRRIEVAEQLWREKRSAKIFASGMLDAEFMIEQLKHNGVDNQALSGERCSQSTEENALFTAALLHPQSVQKILLVTDPPHMLRSVLSFRASGFVVIPHTSPLPASWESERTIPILMREYVGLVAYTLTNRFRQRSLSELERPPSDVTMKLLTWNCKL